MELEIKLINEILTYLGKQPYIEVSGLINAIVEAGRKSSKEENASGE